MFPSPYGDFVFQPDKAGKTHSIKVEEVSVPLRGFCFSTSGNRARGYLPVVPWFPSPYGDFVFQLSLRKALSFLT